MTQGLGILEFFLGILEFVLGILELPVNSLGNFRICLRNSRIPSKFS